MINADQVPLKYEGTVVGYATISDGQIEATILDESITRKLWGEPLQMSINIDNPTT